MEKENENNKRTFVLTDETVNSYGYRVLTSGAMVDRFRNNPVMLYCHNDCTLPIGRWENLREENGRLLADAVFDRKDQFALEVERKVDEGLIRCCSIGFEVLDYDESDKLKVPGQRLGTVTKWELFECSICAIGSNRNAMRLSHEPGIPAPVFSAGIRLTLTRADERDISINQNISEIMTDQERQEMEQLRSQVQTLQTENQTLTAERDNLREAARVAREAEIDGLLAAAVNDGRIAETDRPQWKELLNVAPENAKAALAKLHTRSSLAQMMGQNKGKGEFAGKSWQELDRAGRLAAFKAADPEGFKALYHETFGVDYKE